MRELVAIFLLLVLHAAGGLAQEPDSASEGRPSTQEIEREDTSRTTYVVVGAAMGFVGGYAWAGCHEGICLIGTAIGAFIGYIIGSAEEDENSESGYHLYDDGEKGRFRPRYSSMPADSIASELKKPFLDSPYSFRIVGE
jgi:hypothetical protein